MGIPHVWRQGAKEIKGQIEKQKGGQDLNLGQCRTGQDRKEKKKGNNRTGKVMTGQDRK